MSNTILFFIRGLGGLVGFEPRDAAVRLLALGMLKDYTREGYDADMISSDFKAVGDELKRSAEHHTQEHV